jgi:hypothetical protein
LRKAYPCLVRGNFNGLGAVFGPGFSRAQHRQDSMDSWGHDTNCIIGGAMNGLSVLIFGNVYHVPLMVRLMKKCLPTQFSTHWCCCNRAWQFFLLARRRRPQAGSGGRSPPTTTINPQNRWNSGCPNWRDSNVNR